MFTPKERLALRDKAVAELLALLINAGFQPIQVDGGALAIPVADEAVKYTISVPKGPKDGAGWDFLADAEDFTAKQAEKVEQAKAREVKSKAKQAERQAKDEAKAKAKAEAEG